MKRTLPLSVAILAFALLATDTVHGAITAAGDTQTGETDPTKAGEKTRLALA